MKRFHQLLKNLSERLDLPQPLKSRILLEIAADIQDLYHTYIDQGLSDPEAFERTQEKIDLDEINLSELIRIHQSPLKRWLDGVSSQAKTTWERMLMALLFVVILVGYARTLWMTPFLHNAGPFVWLILGMGFLIIILFLERFYRLYLLKDHRLGHIRKPISAIALLSGLSLFTGVIGYFLEMLRPEGQSLFFDYKLIILVSTEFPTGENVLDKTADWMIRSSLLISVSMFVAMAGAVLWFILERKVRNIEHAEIAFLFEDE